ncbi:Papain family cysteine protease [compost metagenome]
MNDIVAYGPVHASYYVYSDFYYYKSGVYTHTYGSFVAGHAIRIVGWGTDSASGLPYWIVANSWGPNWGMNGYFWIRRGTNECSIEASIYSARPL